MGAKEGVSLSRRQFIVSASVIAGGLALGIVPAPVSADTTVRGPWSPDESQGNELSPWIEIRPDNRVIIRTPSPEIGNGAMTQIAMNVAEELGCDWSLVSVAFCAIHRDHREDGVYNVGFLPFFGGHGTERKRMRHALQLGASARERLKSVAAARWGVPVTEVDARQSLLRHEASGRQLTYGEVAADAVKVRLEQEPALKPDSEWTLIGRFTPGKLHNPQVVTGETVFGIDVKVPGMVHAALLQCPVHGGRLKSYDAEAVRHMPGVRAVVAIDPARTVGTPVQHKATWGFDTNQLQSAVAVIADHYWQARMALDALPVEWDLGEGVKWHSADDIYTAASQLLDTDEGTVLRELGDVAAVTEGVVVEGQYSTPYGENAMIEPLAGTALVTDQHAEVWCGTQDMIQAFWVAIDETGLMPEQVKVHQTFVGGRFGRGTQGDDVRMIVAVAREYPGVPVKTIWSREECFRQGRLRTPVITRFKARLGDDGYPTAVTSKTCFVGTHPLFQLTLGYDDMPYFTSGIIPNVHIARTNFPVHVMNGAYRGPCYNSHAFLVETFIDECAVAAGIDPLAYRLHLVSQWDRAWTDCLRVAADKAGWGQQLEPGEGMGIAITSWPAGATHHAGTIICAVARVHVSRSGRLSVRQVDVAFDCGRVANEDAVRCQIEGGTLFGLNMTLNEEIGIRDGAVANTNFHQYPMLRLGDELPGIRVHFDALSGHERFDIVGEAPVGPVGPAIGNAIFQATGKRLRSTPFRKHDLSWR